MSCAGSTETLEPLFTHVADFMARCREVEEKLGDGLEVNERLWGRRPDHGAPADRLRGGPGDPRRDQGHHEAGAVTRRSGKTRKELLELVVEDLQRAVDRHYRSEPVDIGATDDDTTFGVELIDAGRERVA
jgi:hypothetical protein